MTNKFALLLYSPFYIIIWILLFNTSKQQKGYFIRQCLGFYVSLILWTSCEMLFYILQSPAILKYIFDFKLIFVSFVALFFFLMVAGFYRLNKIFPKWFVPFLYAFSILTSCIAVTSPLHALILKSFTIAPSPVLVSFTYERGIWFFVHMVYCQLLAIGSASMILVRFQELPRAYNGSSRFMMVCLLVYFVFTFLETSGLKQRIDILLPTSVANVSIIDLNLIGSLIAGTFCYVATLANTRIDFMHIDIREVFHYFDESIFILDADNRIIDMNMAALLDFAFLRPYSAYIPFPEMLAMLASEGHIRIQPSVNEDMQYIYVLDTGYPRIYQMRTQPFISEDHQEGRLSILTNTTNEWLLMERLTETAGIDALTKLPNRYHYQNMLRQMDVDTALPFSVIIGDVNGLKHINDTYGHQAGDQHLQKISAILNANCPAKGFLARFGGDEFALLIPRFTAANVETLLTKIRHALQEAFQCDDYSSLIAFGCATKTEPSQNINELINDADFRMYEEKKAMYSQQKAEVIAHE